MPKFCPSCGMPLPDENAQNCLECGAVVRPPVPEKTEIRDPWVAVLLSFFCAGWGQWYNGSTLGGLKFFLASLGLGILALALTFTSIVSSPVSGIMGLAFIAVLVLLGVWIYGMYDSWTMAEKINRGETGFTGKSGMFWLPVILIILVPVLLFVSALVATMVFATAGSVQHTKVVAVTAYRPDAGHIVITYQGGQDAASLQSISVTDNGAVAGGITIPAGRGLTSLPVGMNTTVPASTQASNHIVVTGLFSDGTSQVILDITL